jgi:hypothetical protein
LPTVTGHIRDLVAHFEPVSLERLEKSASLERRVDNKYLIDRDQLERLVAGLEAEHRVLEIDGERASAYESVYFDTESLRCYHDHVEDRRPRFKTRSRLYQATGSCVFEVKLKGDDGETDKRHLDQAPEAHGKLTGEDREFLHNTLADAGLEVGEIRPSLITSFVRVTFGARDVAARATCDLAVHFSLPDGPATQLREGYCLIETKSEDGSSPADALLSEFGVEPRSFSKYLVGTQALHGDADAIDPEIARALS